MPRLAALAAALTLLFAGCASPNRPVDPAAYGRPVRVACIGDSITEGNNMPDTRQRYPEQLGVLLGPQWDVRNFGCSGSTLLQRGDKPYRSQPQYAGARAFAPDVVVIMLGTNDSKSWNWKHSGEFTADYTALVRELAALPSHPRIWLCRPMPAWPPSGWGIDPIVIEREVGPLVVSVAGAERTGLIDMFAAFTGRHDLVPDHVHPEAAGAALFARTVARALTGREPR